MRLVNDLHYLCLLSPKNMRDLEQKNLKFNDRANDCAIVP
jgi:hypothetical protein